jgi:hypothetical protein
MTIIKKTIFNTYEVQNIEGDDASLSFIYEGCMYIYDEDKAGIDDRFFIPERLGCEADFVTKIIGEFLLARSNTALPFLELERVFLQEFVAAIDAMLWSKDLISIEKFNTKHASNYSIEKQVFACDVLQNNKSMQFFKVIATLKPLDNPEILKATIVHQYTGQAKI